MQSYFVFSATELQKTVKIHRLRLRCLVLCQLRIRPYERRLNQMLLRIGITATFGMRFMNLGPWRNRSHMNQP